MKCSSVFKGCLAGLLLLTVAWKVAVPIEIYDAPRDDLVAFFERQNFEVTTDAANNVQIVRATNASCRLQAARLSPDGSNQNLVEHLAAGQGRSFVVFGGTVYTEQPILWTVLAYFRSRILRELGFAERIAAVVSVTANSSCNAEQLPWKELPGM